MKKPRKKTSKVIIRRQQKERDIILECLQKTPIVQIACAKAGISRGTYYRWLEEDEGFRLEVEDAKKKGVDMVNDMAESVIIKGIQESNMGATKYWLSHNSYKYNNRRKPENPDDGGPLRIVLDL